MYKPPLKEDWKSIIKYAWSVRLMALSATLAALEVAIPLLASGFPPHVFALLSAVAAMAGVVSRVIVQQKLKGGDE